MSSLRPEARELIRAGREALRPTPADRERIARALSERIGAGAGGLANAPAAAAKAQVLSVPVVSAVVAGIAAGGLFLAGALRTTDLAPVPNAAPSLSVAMQAPVAPSAAPVATGSEVAAPAPAEEARAEGPAPSGDVAPDGAQARARRQQQDRLAEEVAILSRAQTELHLGRFASVLRVLDEHARKFPRGTLAQERRATRIQALCGAGRTSEADAELARLSPGSVHELRARQACDARRKQSSR